ncbi:MAG: hypothetical protein AAGA75_28530 [Cyanobacteria bacterium P01_E01_bin.6]
MTLDLTLRNYTVTISNADGTSSLDVTSLMLSCVASNRQLDESGLIDTTGNLVLTAFPNASFPESLNPRLNPTRWARGAQIDIRVANASGTLVRHPRGRLRILQVPRTPSPSNPILEIPLGCMLSLQDYRQPPGEDTGITAGTSTSRTSAINTLAGLAGLGTLQDTIAEYPINSPLPRLSGGYVSQMGQLAYAAGYCLWIDNQERLKAVRLPKTPTLAFEIKLGRDEAEFLPLDVNETPPKKIIVFSTYSKAVQTQDPPDELVVAADDVYEPSQTSLTKWTGMGTATPTSNQVVEQPLGLLMPDQYPDNRGLETATETTVTEDYSLSTELLESRTTITKAPRGVILPTTYPGIRTLEQSIKTIFVVDYQNGQVVRETDYTYEPYGTVYPQGNSGNAILDATASDFTEVLSEMSTTWWRETNKGWAKTESKRVFGTGNASLHDLAKFSKFFCFKKKKET